ncbi:hypothetical protein ABPG72_017970 [Tetrahymena utriculariae]
MKSSSNNIKSLSKEQRILSLYQSGIKDATKIHRLVKRVCKISISTVYRIINKIKLGQPLQRKERDDKGIVKSISKPQQQKIKKFMSKQHKITASIIKKKVKLEASLSTIKRYLKREEYIYSKICTVPILTEVQKKNRVYFCEKHKKDNLKDAVFVDECSIETYTSSKKTWMKKGQIQHVPKPKHPLKVHIWGDFKEEPTKMERNKIKKILLFQDKDPKHTASISTNFLKDNKINWVSDWPANSPDLNPIENVWHYLKSKIQEDFPTNKNTLINSIKKQWKTVTPELCQKYMNSWEKRCEEVIQNKGNTINY